MPRVPAAGPWVVISIFYFSAFHRQQSLAGFGAGTGFYVFIFAFFIFIFLVSNVIIMVCCRRHRRRHHHIIISIIIKFIPTHHHSHQFISLLLQLRSLQYNIGRVLLAFVPPPSVPGSNCCAAAASSARAGAMFCRCRGGDIEVGHETLVNQTGGSNPAKPSNLQFGSIWGWFSSFK